MAPKSKSQRKIDFTQLFEAKSKEFSKAKVLVEAAVVEEDRLETVSALPEHEIYGFDNEISLLKNFLLNQKVYDEFKSFVLVGDYGVGKTTLCKMIFNNDDVKNVYAPRIWVSMHRKESKEGHDGKISVLRSILKCLVLEDDDMFESIHREVVEDAASKQEAGEINEETAKEKELSALLYAVYLNLKWKKYLIVIDDLREFDNWDGKLDEKWGTHLSDGFPKGSGGRVIYTTREETLAKKLVTEEHEIHRLWSLTDTESVWKIYEAALKESGKEIPKKDQKCIDELLNKSRGLPLAARVMGMLVPVFAPAKLDGENGSSHGQTDPSNNSN